MSTRDELSFDVVGVGCGVATLSTILRLLKRCKQEGGGTRPPPSVLILDKGAGPGAHILSGAVIDPAPLTDLLDEAELAALPVFTRVASEKVAFLTLRGAMSMPWVPGKMKAKGYPIVSLAAVTQYLAAACEKAGAEIYHGFPAVDFLREGSRITGVRIGDKGIDKHGGRRSSFEAGPDILAKVVVLGEGACGVLSEKLIAGGRQGGANPQMYALGIKEIIETPAREGMAGTILHTFGYPHDYRTYGGGFVYCLSDTLTAVGLVTALDYRHPGLNPHDLFRLFKLHPAVHRFVADGKVLEYGAKVLPEGGLHSIPALVADGALMVGDSAGLLDSLRLKGTHLAVQSGLSAGDTLFECWKSDDYALSALQRYPAALQKTSGWADLKRIRNVRASFRFGRLPGLAAVGLNIVTGGLLPGGRMRVEQDRDSLKRKQDVRPLPAPPKVDGADVHLQLDRLSDVYFSKTSHEENQPSHLRILDRQQCVRCAERYGSPCTRFCPAQVYNLEDDGVTIRVDFSNCLHCKTCHIKDPFTNIEWTPPEGGGGPRYVKM
jgi:electron-transferring-flavoprotein dehydrogenase